MILNSPFIFKPVFSYEFTDDIGSGWVYTVPAGSSLAVSGGNLIVTQAQNSVTYVPVTLADGEAVSYHIRPDQNLAGVYLRGSTAGIITAGYAGQTYIQYVDGSGFYMGPIANGGFFPTGVWGYVMFRRSAANILVETSTNGTAWTQRASVPLTSLGGSVVGVGFRSESSSGVICTVDWIRKTP